MIGDVDCDERRTAVVGTEPTDEPFGFTAYAAIASARDRLGPVVVQAHHLPYGVWWDRLRPTVALRRQPVEPDGAGQLLPLDGLWDAGGAFVSTDDDRYPELAAAYRTGDGLF